MLLKSSPSSLFDRAASATSGHIGSFRAASGRRGGSPPSDPVPEYVPCSHLLFHGFLPSAPRSAAWLPPSPASVPARRTVLTGSPSALTVMALSGIGKLIKSGQENNTAVPILLPDPLRRLDAVNSRHLDVQIAIWIFSSS